jgi:hypothetical protein
MRSLLLEAQHYALLDRRLGETAPLKQRKSQGYDTMHAHLVELGKEKCI